MGVIKKDNAEKVYKILTYGDTIKNFRKQFGLPDEGFKSGKSFEKWYSTVYLLRKNKFNETKIRKRVVNDYEDAEIDLKIKTLSFFDAINAIIRQFKIPEHFLDFVVDCLVLTRPPKKFKPAPPDPKVEVKRNDITGRNELWIRVYGHTDLKAYFKQPLLYKLFSELSKLHDYQPTTKELHIDLYNARHMQKLSYKELMKYAYKRYGVKFKSTDAIDKILQRIK